MRKKNQRKSTAQLNAGQNNQKKSLNSNGNTGIKKQYLKTCSACNVTFRLPREAAPEAQFISVVGDFNNWNTSETLMKKLKNGDFKLTLQLPSNREYRFRYLIDGNHWENDWCADKYIPNSYGCDDSVLII